MMDELISIAYITRPHGVRGEVIAEILTDFPDRFAEMEQAIVKNAGGEILSLGMAGARFHKGRVILKFAGYDNVERAKELRNASVCVTHDQLVELPEATWYDFELIDCEATTVAGERIGVVKRIDRFGAAPLLALKTDDHREILIPLALSICIEIDAANKRIVVDPPEGLLDL